MNTEFYSVEQLARILQLHPKTILRFIHEGTIKAQKIGRSWRVSQEALKEYSHAELARPLKPSDPREFSLFVNRMKVSAVIEINEQESADASRISNTLLAVLNGKDPAWGESRFDYFYYPETRKAKYVLYGTAAFIAEIMTMFSRLEEA